MGREGAACHDLVVCRQAIEPMFALEVRVVFALDVALHVDDVRPFLAVLMRETRP